MRKIPSMFWVPLFLLSSSFSVALDYSVITPRDSLKDGDTLSSTDRVFQLGFFSFDPEEQPQHRFLCLWYKQPFAVVWEERRSKLFLSVRILERLVLHRSSSYGTREHLIQLQIHVECARSKLLMDSSTRYRLKIGSKHHRETPEVYPVEATRVELS
ncbi:unnamed protein product [Brassica napus]|uniref:(rape) hypothetical protein n=1 Tax=Brassica napus TaxID=3708 RepID=A0A816XU18_BRANA|nr:unnamed protein product [Brassica napus]